MGNQSQLLFVEVPIHVDNPIHTVVSLKMAQTAKCRVVFSFHSFSTGPNYFKKRARPKKASTMFPSLAIDAEFECFLMDINCEKKTHVFPDILGQLASMIATQSPYGVGSSIMECNRKGVSFKEIELYFRIAGIDYWLIAVGSSPKYSISILRSSPYDAFKQHFNKKSAYTENFNKLGECEFLIKK